MGNNRVATRGSVAQSASSHDGAAPCQGWCRTFGTAVPRARVHDAQCDEEHGERPASRQSITAYEGVGETHIA